MTQFKLIAIKIITEQELIIGPMAWFEAKKVVGLVIVDQAKGQVNFDGDEKVVIDKLVAQYERLFGRTSREVCKEACQGLLAELASDQIPSSLK